MDFFYCETSFSRKTTMPAGEASLLNGGKAPLRRYLREKRRALASGICGQQRSLSMQKRVLESPLWQMSHRVVLYMPLKEEPDTSLLLAEALRSGRDVFLPRCRKNEPGKMDMLLCQNPSQLELSSMGILEPRISAYSRMLSKEHLCAGGETLIIVPALAFDRSGFRLGYGGGYYDRILAHANCSTVGLAFHALLFPILPRDDWDIPVKAICTEEELLCL